MNKTLTKLSSVAVLLALSACSTAPKTNEVAQRDESLQKIKIAELFADRFLAANNPGGYLFVELVDRTLAENINNLSKVNTLFREIEVRAGMKAGSITASNYKSIFNDEKFPLNEAQAADVIAMSSVNRSFAEITTNEHVMSQVKSIRKLNEVKTTETNLSAKAQTLFEKTNQLKQLPTKYGRVTAKDWAETFQITNGELPVLNMNDPAHNPCSVLTDLSEGAGKNAAEIIHKEATGIKEVYADGSVSNKKSCALAWVSRQFASGMLKLNQLAERIGTVGESAANECYLYLQEAIAPLKGIPMAELATLKLQNGAYQSGGYKALNECRN